MKERKEKPKYGCPRLHPPFWASRLIDGEKERKVGAKIILAATLLMGIDITNQILPEVRKGRGGAMSILPLKRLGEKGGGGWASTPILRFSGNT